MNKSMQVCVNDPRGCFQVLAMRKYMPSVPGYHNFRESFHSLFLAQSYAARLATDTSYHTGYEWVQVADVLTGQVWDFEDGKWTVQNIDADSKQVLREVRSDSEVAKMLLDDVKDYWTARDGRLLVNFHDKGVWRMLADATELDWDSRESLVMLPAGQAAITYATVEQAYSWLRCAISNSYCLDILCISPNHPNAGKLVYDLERRFQELLKQGDE